MGESSLLREAAPDACATPVSKGKREVGVDGGGGLVVPVPPLGDEVVGAVKVLRKAAGHLCEDHLKIKGYLVPSFQPDFG